MANRPKALAAREVTAVDSYRAEEWARLQGLLAASWGQAMRGDLNAVNACLRAAESGIRLLGLAG